MLEVHFLLLHEVYDWYRVLHDFDVCVRLCLCVCIRYVSFSELIQTELHHMRTLHIMERVFRQGMLEELQLDPSTVHAMFPCLDQLTRIHCHFLAQLLLRRISSLQPGSSRNFTIHQLGDILLEQVSAMHSYRYLFDSVIELELKCNSVSCVGLAEEQEVLSIPGPLLIHLIYFCSISMFEYLSFFGHALLDSFDYLVILIHAFCPDGLYTCGQCWGVTSYM